jgi:hypothetical protein
MNKERYKGLDNKQIAMIYYRFSSHKTKLEQLLESGHLPKEVNTPFGRVTALHSYSEKEIDRFRDSEYYALVCSIVETLQPVVEIIEEWDETVVDLKTVLK